MAAEPARPEPVLRNGRGHNSERPAYSQKKEIKEFREVGELKGVSGRFEVQKPRGLLQLRKTYSAW